MPMSFLGRNTEKVGGSRFFTEEATALLYLFKNNHPKTNCSAARNKIEKYVLPLCMQSQRAKDNRYRRMKFLGSLLLLLSAVGHAQVFPVQGNLQIAPPYSPFLTDYTALGTQKLSLVTLKGAAKNSIVGGQKTAIEAEMKKAIEEKLNELGGLLNRRSEAITAQLKE